MTSSVSLFAILLALCLAASAGASASAGAANWHPVTAPGGKAAAAAGQFSGTFAITGPAGLGLASSAPASADAQGRALVRLKAKHVSGSGALLVGSSPDDAVPTLSIPADGAEHNVELYLVRPAGTAIYVGAAPGDQWTFSAPAATTWPQQQIEHLWDQAMLPAPLPANWQPKGLLDGRVINIGKDQRLQVSPGSMRIVMAPSADVQRGLRGEVPADAMNASSAPTTVSEVLEGPPSVWLPRINVPVQGSETITLRPEFASFWMGKTWARLTFGCQGMQASLPVRLTTTPAYPAFGIFLGAGATRAQLAAALKEPASAVMAPARLWTAQGKPPASRPEGVAYGSAADLLALAATQAADWCRIVCVWGPSASWAEGVKELAASPRAQDGRWILTAGPATTTATPNGMTVGGEDLAALTDCAASLSCVTIRPPALPAVTVAHAQASGLPDTAFTFWHEIDRRFDATPLRAQLSDAGLNLPVLWAGMTAAAPAGAPDEGANRAAWARAAASLLYCGATGIFTRQAASAQQAGSGHPGAAGGPSGWLDAMRELSTVTPVMSPSETDFARTNVGGGPFSVMYKPFLRGREGTVVMSNSTGQTLNVACEVRAEPMEANLVRFAPGAEELRTHVMPFRFTDEAFKLGRPFVFLRMLPGETALLNLRLVDPSPAWLRGVQAKPVSTQRGPTSNPVPIGSDWWGKAQQMRENSRGR